LETNNHNTKEESQKLTSKSTTILVTDTTDVTNKTSQTNFNHTTDLITNSPISIDPLRDYLNTIEESHNSTSKNPNLLTNNNNDVTQNTSPTIMEPTKPIISIDPLLDFLNTLPSKKPYSEDFDINNIIIKPLEHTKILTTKTGTKQTEPKSPEHISMDIQEITTTPMQQDIPKEPIKELTSAQRFWARMMSSNKKETD
jgi:hypothetical protein